MSPSSTPAATQRSTRPAAPAFWRCTWRVRNERSLENKTVSVSSALPARRVVSVQAPRQVLQQTLGRHVAVRVGAREDRLHPRPLCLEMLQDVPALMDLTTSRMSGSRPCRGPSRHRRSPAGSGRCAARGCRDWSRAPDRPSRSPWPLPTGRAGVSMPRATTIQVHPRARHQSAAPPGPARRAASPATHPAAPESARQSVD